MDVRKSVSVLFVSPNMITTMHMPILTTGLFAPEFQSMMDANKEQHLILPDKASGNTYTCAII